MVVTNLNHSSYLYNYNYLYKISLETTALGARHAVLGAATKESGGFGIRNYRGIKRKMCGGRVGNPRPQGR